MLSPTPYVVPPPLCRYDINPAWDDSSRWRLHMCHKLPPVRRICNVLLAGPTHTMCIRDEELLCALFNGPNFVLAATSVRDSYMPWHSSGWDLCPMPIWEEGYGDATFMIGSVTKLILYADPLAATHNDGIKRDREGERERGISLKERSSLVGSSLMPVQKLCDTTTIRFNIQTQTETSFFQNDSQWILDYSWKFGYAIDNKVII